MDDLLQELKRRGSSASFDYIRIKGKFEYVDKHVKNEYVMGDSEARMIIDEALLKYVKELDLVLLDKNVRGHQEMRLPEITQEMTTGQLLKRFKKQTKACCNLSNAIYKGPPENPQESAVFARFDEIFNHIIDVLRSASKKK